MIVDELSMDRPLVSIIMSARNAEKYLIKAINSVQNQRVVNWELIVIDDASDDATPEIVGALAAQDPRIKLIQNAKNEGVGRSRNKALDICQGEYVAFLDSDDTWCEEKLEIQLAHFKNEVADLIYTSYAIVDENGEKVCEDFTVPSRVDFEGLLKQNVIGCSTVLAKAAVIKKYRFSETVYHEDYALWLTMLRDGCVAAGERQVLVRYCYHEDSKAGDKYNSAQQRWKLYREYLKLSFAKSVWYFLHYALAGLKKYKKV